MKHVVEPKFKVDQKVLIDGYNSAKAVVVDVRRCHSPDTGEEFIYLVHQFMNDVTGTSRQERLIVEGRLTADGGSSERVLSPSEQAKIMYDKMDKINSEVGKFRIEVDIPRRVVQIAICKNPDNTIVALCNDGTMWVESHLTKNVRWIQVHDIPQPSKEASGE